MPTRHETGPGPDAMPSARMFFLLAAIAASARGAGSASGWVLVGLGVAPPFDGYTFDTSGSYTTMWFIAAGTAVLAVVMMVLWSRSEQRRAAA